jgi:hypothetical protein
MQECNAPTLGAQLWPGGTTAPVYYVADPATPGGYKLVVASIASQNYGSVPAVANNGVIGTASATGSNAMSIAWGDGTQKLLNFGTKAAGVFAPRFKFMDTGRLSIGFNTEPAAPTVANLELYTGGQTSGIHIQQTNGDVDAINIGRSNTGVTASLKIDDFGRLAIGTNAYVPGTFATGGSITSNGGFSSTGSLSGYGMLDRTDWASSKNWLAYANANAFRVWNGTNGDRLIVGLDGVTTVYATSGATQGALNVSQYRGPGPDSTWNRSQILIDSQGSSASSNLAFRANNTSAQLNCVESTGVRLNVVNGDNTASAAISASAFTVTSSRRYKVDIETAAIDAVDVVASLRPVTFHNKVTGDAHDCALEDCGGTTERPCPLGMSKALRFGLIAEEVAEVFQYGALYDLEGEAESLDYGSLTALAIAAIKDLAARIAVLEAA